MLKRLFFMLSLFCFSISLVGCSDDSGNMSMEYSKEAMGRSGVELESAKSRMDAMRDSKKNNTLPPPREDGQHDINFPSWIGGYEKQD